MSHFIRHYKGFIALFMLLSFFWQTVAFSGTVSSMMEHNMMMMDKHEVDNSLMDHQTMDHQTMDHQTMDHQTMDHQTMDHESMDCSCIVVCACPVSFCMFQAFLTNTNVGDKLDSSAVRINLSIAVFLPDFSYFLYRPPITPSTSILLG